LLFDVNRNSNVRAINPHANPSRARHVVSCTHTKHSHIFVTRLSLRVCIADENGVEMFQITARRQVVPVQVRGEIELHLFLTPSLGAVEWTDSLAGRFNPGECAAVPIK
jgi:hypothetical protein